MSAASALPTLEELKPSLEAACCQLVEDSLSLTKWALKVARESTRLGAATAANLTASCAWLLLTGLDAGLERGDSCNQFLVQFTNFSLSLLTSLTNLLKVSLLCFALVWLGKDCFALNINVY